MDAFPLRLDDFISLKALLVSSHWPIRIDASLGVKPWHAPLTLPHIHRLVSGPSSAYRQD